MKCRLTGMLVFLGLLAAFPASASAQTQALPSFYTPPVLRPSLQQPTFRPPVSPYLNLLNGGGNAAINYYGIVRPELRFQTQQQQTSQQLRRLEGEIEDIDTRRPQKAADTSPGPQRYYLNYSHYYPTPGQR
jgi:hypothetical protein